MQNTEDTLHINITTGKKILWGADASAKVLMHLLFDFVVTTFKGLYQISIAFTGKPNQTSLFRTGTYPEGGPWKGID